MSAVVSTSAAISEIKKASEPKPVKLRSACNCCFTAKVRCDGNKEGCKRCAEKHLDCTFSESMVGRVVGKRRKRPLPDSKLGEAASGSQNVAFGPTALPSPAPTNASEPQSKRSCVSNEWECFVQFDNATEEDLSGYDEQFVNLDLCEQPETMSASHTLNTGLPTPTNSPPEMPFLGPSEMESTTPNARPPSSAPFIYQRQMYSTPTSSQLDHQYSEDDESTCIRMLSHLKYLSNQSERSRHSIIALVNRTNAVLTRLLQSSTLKTDYTCHLLLTSIMSHLVALCEQLLSIPEARFDRGFTGQSVFDESGNEMVAVQYPNGVQNVRWQEAAQMLIGDTTVHCTSIGNLLKRKPLNGFQVLGRHEAAQVGLERRLRTALASLS